MMSWTHIPLTFNSTIVKVQIESQPHNNIFCYITNISVHFLPNVEIITFLYTCCNLSCLYSVFHSYKCRNVLQTFKDTSREFFCITPLQCKSHTSCFVKFVCKIDHQSVEKDWIVHLGPCDDFYFIYETF